MFLSVCMQLCTGVSNLFIFSLGYVASVGNVWDKKLFTSESNN